MELLNVYRVTTDRGMYSSYIVAATSEIKAIQVLPDLELRSRIQIEELEVKNKSKRAKLIRATVRGARKI